MWVILRNTQRRTGARLIMSTAGNTTKAAAAKNTGGFLTASSDAACFAAVRFLLAFVEARRVRLVAAAATVKAFITRPV